MVWSTEGEAHEVGCGDFGCGVEGAEAGGEAEVGVVEYDEAECAYETVEGPEDEGGPYVEVMTERFSIGISRRVVERSPVSIYAPVIKRMKISAKEEDTVKDTIRL